MTKRKSLSQIPSVLKPKAAAEQSPRSPQKLKLKSLVSLSARELTNWINTAKPGDVIQYHAGHLTNDRCVLTRQNQPKLAEQLDATANVAWIACVNGLVGLHARRLAANSYEYIAIRSSRPLFDWPAKPDNSHLVVPTNNTTH